MIQDIAPHHFDNAYHSYAPREEDFAIYCQPHQVLLKRQEDRIIFPTFQVLWSSIFVTLLANKINLFCASTLAVSATLDTRAEGCCQVFTDGDELKNRFLFQAPSEWESLTSLCSGVKGMPLRDGCVLTSGSKS